VLHIVGDVSSTMCHIRWHKNYMFHYERQDDVTATLKELARYIPIGVPVEGSKFLLEVSMQDHSLPCKIREMSDANYEAVINMLSSKNDVQSSIGEETSSNIGDTTGLSQELFMSPARAMMENHEDRNSSPSCRDCLKAFNFVYNHFQTQPNGSQKLLTSIWEAYNSSVESMSSNHPKVGNVISFPEVQKSSVNSRKRTAGYL